MPPANPSSPPTKTVVWFLGTVWLILSLNLAWSVALFQPNVLTWDQWDFFAPLFSGGDWRELFTYQHGPHRQGLGFVITSWILDLTRWDARFDSLWIAGLLSLASALALRLKGKLSGRLSWVDAWIPIVGLTLGQFEAILIAPNASHSAFSLALMLALANAWLMRSATVRYLSGGLGAVALTFTGFGLFAGAIMTVLIGVATARDMYRGAWRSAVPGLIGLVIAVAGWAWFRSGYLFVPAVVGFRFPWTPLREYFQFIPLMLLQPTGVSGATTLHYAAGGVLAILITLAALVVLWKWIRTAEPSPGNEVVLFLVGAGALFVCNTAIGRVCLGITAGMSSRYVTLMFPLWLGIYFFAVTTKSRAYWTVSAVALWAIAMWPYRDMTSRALSRWPGTIGATHAQFAYYEQYTSNKAAWVDTYLRTGSIEAAQQARGPAVYPHPPGTRMDEKLAFMKTRGLLFFAPERSFLPYFLGTRTIWNDEYPSSLIPRVVEDNTRLTFVTKQGGFAEMIVSGEQPDGGGVTLEIEYDGSTRKLALPKLPAVVAIPVQPGFNRMTLRRGVAADASRPPVALKVEVPVLRNSPSTGSIAF